MSSTTPNLNLKLTGTSATDNAKKFGEWRQEVNGETGSSNMELIDIAFGRLDTEKADRASGAINNHFAALDQDGNLKDSGKAASDFASSTQGAKADNLDRNGVRTDIGQTFSVEQMTTARDNIGAAYSVDVSCLYERLDRASDLTPTADVSPGRAIRPDGMGVSIVDGYTIYRYDMANLRGLPLHLELNSYGEYCKASFTKEKSLNAGFICKAEDGMIIPENALFLFVTSQDISADKVGIKCGFDIRKQDRLWGKTIYAVGDSITYGANNSRINAYGQSVPVSYVDKIAERHNMRLTNKARGGATLVLHDTTNDMVCIRKQIGSFISSFPAPDYFIFSGGYNDAQNDASTADGARSPLGAIVPVDDKGKNAYVTSTTNFDLNTVCGTVEFLIGQLRVNYPMTKLLYVLTYRVATQYRWGALYAPAIREICQKWAVPVVDLTQDGNMMVNPDYPQNELIFTDGIHPNDEGYERMADMVEAKLMTI